MESNGQETLRMVFDDDAKLYERRRPNYPSELLFCELSLTYSPTRSLPPVTRQDLLDCIARLIESRYNGQITKRYLTEMRLAHRRPACGETGAG
jgi:hypothetical protein